jgi:hypothetical protein
MRWLRPVSADLSVLFRSNLRPSSFRRDKNYGYSLGLSTCCVDIFGVYTHPGRKTHLTPAAEASKLGRRAPEWTAMRRSGLS